MFTLNKAGQISVRLDETMRALIKQVTEELREVLLVEDPELTRRLYPTAYPDDDELEDSYQQVVHDQLLMQRLDGIDQLQASIDDEEISLETADAWMSTINQIRLVLGTKLDVGEEQVKIDEDDPEVTSYVIYQVLSHILEELTSARINAL
jgi:hypothetical protein